MRDFADMLRGLLDAASADDARDDQWSGDANGPVRTGDWCQTAPGGEAIDTLAAQLRRGGR